MVVLQTAKQTSAQGEEFRRKKEKSVPTKGYPFFFRATDNLEKQERETSGQGWAFPD